MAFDLKEPWATHRKYEVFEDKHSDLFGRPEVTADRIALCQVIIEAINAQIPELENQLVGRYVLTRYMFLYIVREILDKDDLAAVLITRPDVFVRTAADRDRFREIVSKIVSDIITDLNVELSELGPDFDYRDKLRDAAWVKNTSKTLVATHTKLISRKYIRSFRADWENWIDDDQTAAQ